MLDLRKYKLLYKEASDIVVALHQMVEWVNQSNMQPSTVSWVFRYADLKSNPESIDPLLKCGEFAKLLPFDVRYSAPNITILYTDEKQQALFNELIYGLNGVINIAPNKDVCCQYKVRVNKRLVLVDYYHELIDGFHVECVKVSIKKQG